MTQTLPFCNVIYFFCIYRIKKSEFLLLSHERSLLLFSCCQPQFVQLYKSIKTQRYKRWYKVDDVMIMLTKNQFLKNDLLAFLRDREHECPVLCWVFNVQSCLKASEQATQVAENVRQFGTFGDCDRHLSIEVLFPCLREIICLKSLSKSAMVDNYWSEKSVIGGIDLAILMSVHQKLPSIPIDGLFCSPEAGS